MLTVTKIFYFEMAHAIDGYSGPCRNVHGHSYELHVTVSGAAGGDEFIPAPGFIFDFKELKQLVQSTVLETLDHKLVLSHNYLSKNSQLYSQENLVQWDPEPTAENILIYIRMILQSKMPAAVNLNSLTLYETKSCYAAWRNEQSFQ